MKIKNTVNSLSKANAKLYRLTNNYFKFQKYFLDLSAILNNNTKKIDNKVVSTPCVLFSELLTQWAEATLLLFFSATFWICKGISQMDAERNPLVICVDCHAFIKARPLCAPHGDDEFFYSQTIDKFHKILYYIN